MSTLNENMNMIYSFKTDFKTLNSQDFILLC